MLSVKGFRLPPAEKSRLTFLGNMMLPTEVLGAGAMAAGVEPMALSRPWIFAALSVVPSAVVT